MRSWKNEKLLRAVVVLAAAATLIGVIDVLAGASDRRDAARLEKRVGELERRLESLQEKRP
jgi:hypothetical protein